MHTAIADIETDGLDPTIVWVVVCRDPDTSKTTVFRRPDLDPEPLKEYARHVDRWVFHNGIGFDHPSLVRLCPTVSIPINSILDTLVLSRLFNYSVQGGHSLEEWGKRFGKHKVVHEDWTQLTPAMVDRCIGDVDITELLYKKLLPYVNSERWASAIYTEHQMAIVCSEMTRTGFTFNAARARELKIEIDDRLGELERVIQTSFPPKAVPHGDVIIPKLTKQGTLSRSNLRFAGDDLTQFSPDAQFTRISWESFNPGSPKQIVERLNKAGWKPFEKTKGHTKALQARPRDKEKLKHYAVYGWQASEANLATLPEDAPEGARKLREWLLMADRSGSLTEWLAHYNEADGRVHPQFMPIGAWTHRMAHQKPNTGNIVSAEFNKDKTPKWGIDGNYGSDFRALWTVPKGRYLVGVDAEGIQLRILAHYMDDEKFTYGVTYGKKEDGTDPHTLNMVALNRSSNEQICKSRDAAKTFIYAWLLGAGLGKVASILECSLSDAKRAVEAFIEAYPGLKELKNKIIPADAARGYFEGLDKRLVVCDNTHLMLAGYLQNGEAVIMKLATVLWRERLIKERLAKDVLLLNLVHDEWQTEVANRELAEYVASVQADSIREVGEILKLRCPLAGSSSIGTNWLETH